MKPSVLVNHQNDHQLKPPQLKLHSPWSVVLPAGIVCGLYNSRQKLSPFLHQFLNLSQVSNGFWSCRAPVQIETGLNFGSFH